MWLDTLPIAQAERAFSGSTVTSSQLVYLHADQLNTPRLATNSSGTVIWRWDSDAFGVGDADDDPDSDTNVVNIRLRFPGQYLDDETGVHYNYFRDYDAATGRYLEADPIGLLGGLSSYPYAKANPLSWTDRLGLLPNCDFIVQRLERRAWTESERDVWGYARRLEFGDLEGVSVAENLDPRRPRQPPIGPAIRLQVWLATYEYGYERRFAVEQVVEHLRAFCTAVFQTCGSEEEEVMEPFSTTRHHPELRTEIGGGYYERLVSAVGAYVDLGIR